MHSKISKQQRATKIVNTKKWRIQFIGSNNGLEEKAILRRGEMGKGMKENSSDSIKRDRQSGFGEKLGSNKEGRCRDVVGHVSCAEKTHRKATW